MSDPVTFTALPSRALIAIGGEDWRTFLQNLLSQSVEDVAPGEARFAGLLTPQGRLLYDLFVVGRQDGSAFLDVAAEHRAAILQRLTMYKLRAKVTLGLDETPVSALLGQTAPGFVPDPRLPALGARGYGVSPPQGAAIADEGTYEAFRLSLGVPGPADWGTDRTYPIEANFDLLEGVDFKKGCFIGQETTSRMKRRGQVKNRMLPITFEGPPPAFGAELLTGDRRAGEVLSGVDGRAMALVRLDRIAGDLQVDGRPVRIERPGWFQAALGEEVAEA